MGSLPTGIVTFLFTDLEGSTRLWEEQPGAMRDALAQHDAILSEAIEAHHGAVFSKMGDGMAAAFELAADACAAALEAELGLQAAQWGSTGALHVRMGLHAAEAHLRADGEYVNRPLNQCARIMAAASGGQVLISDTAEELARDRLPAHASVVDLGTHRLRDLARPVHIFQLVHPELRAAFPPLRSLDAFPAITTVPQPALVREGGALAGRDDELDRLTSAWARMGEGVRQVRLLVGEAGVGKTRLAAELGRWVYAHGGVVLYGRCDEDAIVPYQPFVEALRPYVAGYPPSTMHERLHGLEQDLTRLFPELLGRISPPPKMSDPEAERYRLFEAVTVLLTGIAAARPALFVLDDLHWADKPTALLLRHVIRSAPDAALVIVACYRDVDVPRAHPVADLLSDLRREPFADRVVLGGLSERESAALLGGLPGSVDNPAVAAVLHRETGGNPLFLTELHRHLVETDALPPSSVVADEVVRGPLELPEGVRDVVARRLRRLPESVNEVLCVAAVFGSEFDAEPVARAEDKSLDEVLASFDAASEAGLVDEHPDRLGRYAFSHALVRQTLYTELGSARRVRLHARAGRALEEAAGPPPSAAALAHHYVQAAPLGEAPRAIEYATKAGHEAVDDLAFEDAARYFERALELLEHHAPGDTNQRVELLTDSAGALLYVDERAAVDAAVRAVDAARDHGSPAQLGRAAIVLAEPAMTAYPGELPGLFDEALAALGDEHPALRARLLALEAFKYSTYLLHGRDGRALAREAVQLARTAEDPLTLADALLALAVSLEGKPDVSERLALGDELISLGGGTTGERAGDRRLAGRTAIAAAYGLRVHAGVYLELGDSEALAATIAELEEVGEELQWLPARVYAAQWRATRGLVEGRFDDVRASWQEMRGYARAYRGVAGMRAAQAYYLAREQGDLGNLIVVMEQLAEGTPDNLYVRAMLALAQSDGGDDAAALRTLEHALADDFQRGEGESAWGAVLGLFAEVVANGGTPEQAALLYEHLVRYAGRLLAAVLGLGCLGAADRYLGMLCAVQARWDDGEVHFERAVALEEQARGRALLPRTRYWQARFLRTRGRSGDDRAADALITDLAAESTRLGMLSLRERAEALRAS